MNFMPPSILICEKLTVNALKALYAVCYSNPNFQMAIIDYDPYSLLNMGIGYTWRQKCYELPATLPKLIGWYACNIFVKDPMFF